MKNEQEIEQMIEAKGLNRPRISPALLDQMVAHSEITYHIPPNTMLTICTIRLATGFTVTGESACVSPENFNEQLGQNIALKNARDKLWVLEGYLLSERLDLMEREARQADRPGKEVAGRLSDFYQINESADIDDAVIVGKVSYE